LRRVTEGSPNFWVFAPLAKPGSRLVLRSIRKWVRKKGVDLDKPWSRWI